MFLFILIFIFFVILSIAVSCILGVKYTIEKRAAYLLPLLQLVVGLVAFAVLIFITIDTEGWGFIALINVWEHPLFRLLYPVSFLEPLFQEALPGISYFVVFSHFGALQMFVYGYIIDRKQRQVPKLKIKALPVGLTGFYFSALLLIALWTSLKVNKPELIYSNSSMATVDLYKTGGDKLIRTIQRVGDQYLLSDNIYVYQLDGDFNEITRFPIELHITTVSDTLRFMHEAIIRFFDFENDGHPEFIAYDYGDPFFNAKYTDLQHGISFYDERGRREWFKKLNIENVSFLEGTDSTVARIVAVNNSSFAHNFFRKIGG